MLGKTLDSRYEIIQHLSGGAFGQTFIAKDTKRPNSPLCVVKQLKPKHSHPEFLAKAEELFDREASALELLGEHPQIPRLLAHLQIERDFYLVEEYIQGQTLAIELEEGKCSQQQTIDLLLEILKIVAFIHQHNIVHRDIKPNNIIRRRSNRTLVLIDFGAVTKFDGETMLGTIIGTPGYGAPEQYLGRSGFYSDIYAVGAIAIQALTGINPSLLARNERDEIIWQNKAKVSPQFAAILTKAVGRNKGDRYSRAEEFVQDLKRLKSPMAMPPSNRSSPSSPSKVSFPKPPVRVSFSRPPVRLSFPSVPSINLLQLKFGIYRARNSSISRYLLLHKCDRLTTEVFK